MTEDALALAIGRTTEQKHIDFDPPLSRVERDYREWRKTDQGRYIIAVCRSHALAFRSKGRRHYGIKTIWEHLRFEHDMLVRGPKDAFKLNNNFPSFIAREIMADTPELQGFFETRTLHGRHFDPRHHGFS